MPDYGQPYYSDAYDDIYNAAKLGSTQAQFYGNEAAKVADPYGYKRRNDAADKFDALLENPGSINSSPVFKYLRQQQMAPVRAYNAAHGLGQSGRGMLALQDAAKRSSTTAFFPLLEAYGKASGAFNPLSTSAAAYAMRGSERSMDYDQLAAAAKGAAGAPPPSAGLPWWMQGTSSFGSGGGGSSLPTGGSSGTYTPAQLAGAGYPMGPDPRTMSLTQLNAEAGINNYDYGRTIPSNYSNGSYAPPLPSYPDFGGGSNYSDLYSASYGSGGDQLYG